MEVTNCLNNVLTIINGMNVKMRSDNRFEGRIDEHANPTSNNIKPLLYLV